MIHIRCVFHAGLVRGNVVLLCKTVALLLDQSNLWRLQMHTVQNTGHLTDGWIHSKVWMVFQSWQQDKTELLCTYIHIPSIQTLSHK